MCDVLAGGVSGSSFCSLCCGTYGLELLSFASKCFMVFSLPLPRANLQLVDLGFGWFTFNHIVLPSGSYLLELVEGKELKYF